MKSSKSKRLKSVVSGCHAFQSTEIIDIYNSECLERKKTLQGFVQMGNQ